MRASPCGGTSHSSCNVAFTQSYARSRAKGRGTRPLCRTGSDGDMLEESVLACSLAATLVEKACWRNARMQRKPNKAASLVRKGVSPEC